MLRNNILYIFLIFCTFIIFSTCTSSKIVSKAEKNVKDAQSKVDELEKEVLERIEISTENPSDPESQNQVQKAIEDLEEAKQEQRSAEIHLEKVKTEEKKETKEKKDYYFTHFSSYLFKILNHNFKEVSFIVSNGQGGSVTVSSIPVSDKCLKITETEFSSGLNMKVKLIKKDGAETLLNICDSCPARTYEFEEEVTKYKKPESHVNQWVSFSSENEEYELRFFHLYATYSLYSLAEDGKNVEDFLEHRPFYFNEMPDPNSREYYFKPFPQSATYIGVNRYRYNEGTWGSLLPITSTISESDCKTLAYPASPL